MSETSNKVLAPEVQRSPTGWVPAVGAIALAAVLAAYYAYAWSRTRDVNPADPATMLRALALFRWNPLVRAACALTVMLSVAAAGLELIRPATVARKSATAALWGLSAAGLVASLWLTPAAPGTVHIDPVTEAGGYIRGAMLCLLAAVLGLSTLLVTRSTATVGQDKTA